MHPRTLTVAGLPLVLLALGATAAAQFHSRTDLIEIGAVVLDHGGDPVADLAQSDFVIIEDGHPVPITTFVAINADQPATVNDGRFIAILVESRSPTARKIAGQLIDRMGQRDVVAITSVMGSRATTTDDPDVARKQLDDLAKPGAHRPSHSRVGSGPGAIGAMPQPSCAECGTSGTSVGPVLGYPGMSTGGGDEPPASYGRSHSYAATVLDQMSELAGELKQVPHRRKTIVYIGTASQLNLTERDIRNGDSGRWFDVIRKASQVNTAIDIIGTDGANGASHAGARMIADETGGDTLLDTNFYDAGIDRLWQRAGNYYLIGYSPAREKKKQHKVEIRVNRPGLDVHALKFRG
jgi:VWFA-related protein